MTETITPSDLYLKLRSARAALHDAQEEVQRLTGEYRSYDPVALGVDTAGDPITGPEALEATLRALRLLDGSFTASEEFFDEALTYGSRLLIKD
ncbi:hypothetical protein DVG80_32565 [Rhodococcus erythropolis]|nr:hypothetical protein DVG80_32565 [Rhodococcus erythropolis]